MGRMVQCPHCKSTMNEDILKEKNSEHTCLVCGESLDCGEGGEDIHSDWITWYYYGYKSGLSYSIEEKPFDLEKFGDKVYLIKEFKAPPRDETGSSEAAKRELRKYIPDAFPEYKEIPIRCPVCGSKEYTLMNRGYSIFTGFLGSGRVKRVCNSCKRQF